MGALSPACSQVETTIRQLLRCGVLVPLVTFFLVTHSSPPKLDMPFKHQGVVFLVTDAFLKFLFSVR